MDVLDFGLKPLSTYLSDAVRHDLQQRAQRRMFGDGQALHRQGADRARLCLVAEGKVRFGRFQHDGSFKLLSMFPVSTNGTDLRL